MVQLKKLYTYTAYPFGEKPKFPKKKVVFQCTAYTLEEADDTLREMTGYVAAKEVAIGCTVKELVEEDEIRLWENDYLSKTVFGV